MQTVLRSYTGVFADYVHISETLIAQRAGLSEEQVYEMLKMLSKRGIIDYIPMRKVPTIYYTVDRQDIEHMIIPKTVYEERLRRFAARTAKVIEYGSSQTCCRSKMLLRYFGEKNARDCGICDVCLAKRQKEKLEADTARIIPAILHILAAGEMTVEDVADRTEFPVNHILCAVRFLADSGKIEVNDNRLKITHQ